ncbi:MAG: SUMF1/EgtB/PvdO family nonheme iron enzyme, partial [Chloroflexales bacterium]
SRLNRGAVRKPERNRRLRVFLCHASVDKVTVRTLYRRLRSAQIKPWLDEEDLLPGQDWRREIPRAVEAADVVLVCLSRAAQGSTGFLQEEIAFALDVAERQPRDSIFLIPLRLSDCVVPERLARWQWVSLFEPDGFTRLLRALQVRATELGLDRPTLPFLAEQPEPAANAMAGAQANQAELEQARALLLAEQWQQAIALYEQALGYGPLPDSDVANLARARQALRWREVERARKGKRPSQREVGTRAATAHVDVDQTLADLATLFTERTAASAAALVARLAEDAALRPSSCRRAGALAGRLSDPRFPVQLDHWRHDLARLPLGGAPQRWDDLRPPSYWCYLPAEACSIGGWAAGRATTDLDLDAFWLARFPITVAQYEPFAAVGYRPEARRWWEPAGWRWKRSGEEVMQPRWWDEELYRGANQPVIGVSWHEATAFCRWLSEQLADALPNGYRLRLPTEAEWERAAAGNRPAARRRYPWGESAPTPGLAVYNASGVDRPAPVGCCAAGAAACGALDMAGLVWELMTSSYEDYPAGSREVVTELRGKPVSWRGGSWRSDEVDLVCGKRSPAGPDRSSNNVGFRVVLARQLRP